jgi:hypothetical protein
MDFHNPGCLPFTELKVKEKHITALTGCIVPGVPG